jgi:hypothetical protein
MRKFEENLHRILLESAPRLIAIGGSSDGVVNIFIERESGKREEYKYENVPASMDVISQIQNESDKNNPHWLKVWKSLDQYRITPPPAQKRMGRQLRIW